jgi:hypothetical protein
MGFAKQLFTSNKGSTLLITVMGIATIAVVAGLSFYSRAESMAKMSKTYRAQVDNGEIQHELEVIFANQSLCKNLVTISGNTFQVAGVFTTASGGALATNSNIVISQMILENVTAVAGGTQANFTITTRPTDPKLGGSSKKNTVKVIYTANGSGALTDCRLSVGAQTACEELGFSWQASSGRCTICERLGGSWDASACSLVNGQ